MDEAGIPVRVGPNFIMNPQASGIAPAAGFKAPGSRATALKRVRKGRVSFSDALLGPHDNDTGNFFTGR